jgi:pimeloyl-ACP methyl ester carboxylesterase/catechol 2,3-dioxygenase-like lactoylglutathione lyase family enzyme
MHFPTPTSRFASVNGARLHYLDFGGDGPPVVLHHATGFHAWMWTPIARALTERYRVVAVDARGHGDSEKPPSGYSWEAFIADLVAFVESLGLGRVFGVGHSLGGTTTAGAAAERPDLFTMVAALDPILIPREFRNVTTGDNPMALAALRRRERWASADDAFRSYRGRGPFAKWSDEMLRLYVDHGFVADDGAVRLKCPAAVESQVFGMAPHFDSWSVFDRLAVPTLLLRGSLSDAFSAKDAAEALRRLHDGELHTLVDSSHMFPMEKPDEVVEALFAFADSRLPVATRGLAHLALNVVKLEDTVAFYRDVFGMRVVWQPDADNVYLSSGRDNLALHRAREARAKSGSALDHLGFFVENRARVHAVAHALERRGIAIVRPPRDHRDGSTSLYLEDPDGNLVQVLYEPHAVDRRSAAITADVATEGRALRRGGGVR